GFTISSRARLKNGDGVFITTDTAVNTRLLQGERSGRFRLIINTAKTARNRTYSINAKAC
ncbi:MAG: hypothetical protein IIX09_02565, partial [Clostridia bacterium]|nr:hypothetical protein [Clostridia bacterium]